MLNRFLLSLFVFAAGLAPSSMRGAEQLFVFHGGEESATVLDAESLAAVARPRVGFGGSAAFLDRRSGVARYWTVSADAVTLLDDGFATVSTIPLDGLPQAQPSSAFAEPLRRLVVAAGNRLYLIDTESAQLDTTVEIEFQVSAVALRPGAAQAWLLESGTSRLWTVDLLDGAVAPESAALPAIAEALATSPAGLQALAASGAGSFDLAAMPTGTSSALGGSSSASVLAVGDDGSALWRMGGELRLVHGDGLAVALVDPASGQPLADASAAAVGSGGTVFSALADGRLLRYTKPGAAADQMFLAGAASALALTPDPVAQGTQGLIPVSGAGQQVGSGETFVVTVQNGTATPSNLTATASPPGSATCNDTTILGSTALQPATADVTCTAAEVGSTTVISVQVTATIGSATFPNITITAPCTEGLSAISSVNQSIVAGADADFSVQACADNAPAVELELDIDESNAALDCPATDETNSSGIATFSCDSDADLEEETDVEVTVSDGTNDVVFMVTVNPVAQVFDTFEKVSGDNQVVTENSQFNLGVRALTGGTGRSGVNVTVTESSAAIVCPNPPPTASDGRTTIVCQASDVASNQTVQILAAEGGRSVSFTVTILNATQGDGLTKLSGDNQIVSSGASFPLPLVVSSTVNGVPDQFRILDITPDSGAAFCNTQVVTDNSGLAQISCQATNVQAITQVAIQVVNSVTNNDLDEPFRATIVPGTAGSADSVDVLTAQVNGQAGQTIENGVRVRARNGGDLAAGVPIFFGSDQDVTFDPPVANTNLAGEAATDVTLGCTSSSGTIRVGLTQGAADATIPFNTTAGSLAVLEKVAGDEQSGGSGLIFPLALLLRTTDVCGTPIANQPVSWSIIPPAAGELVSPVTVSNGQGRASTRIRAGIIAGEFTVRARSGDIQTDFTLTVTNTPTTLEAFSGGGQQVPAGEAAPLPIVARVLNEQGQPVQGISVDFRVVSGSGQVSPLIAVTNAQGQAQTTFTAGASLGAVVIEAAAIERTANFNLNVVGGVPMVPIEGFVNGASFRTGFSPLATGSIFGTGIVDDEGVHVAPFPFPTTFRGVQIRINDIAAPILALINQNGQEQINIQVPAEVQPGTLATVVITNNGSQASFNGVPIFQTQPGIFEVTVGAARFAAALDADFQLIEPGNPVAPGGVVQLYVTGLGPLSPAVGTNEVGPVPAATVAGDVAVGLNGEGIPILGAFYAPGFVTLYQINFLVPADLAPGQYQVSVVVGGVGSQNATLVVGN